MKSLLKKVRGDKKGFTLAELLVVVAIIAILVAVSIPIFTAQLGKARKATNEANLRAAKAAAVAEYLTDEDANKKTTTVYFYNIKAGTVSKESDTSKIKDADKVEIGESSVSTTKVYDNIRVKITANTEANDKNDILNTASIELYAN